MINSVIIKVKLAKLKIKCREIYDDLKKGDNIKRRKNNKIDSYPRKVLIFLVLGTGCLWQSIGAFLALCLYILFICVFDVSKLILGFVSIIVLLISIYLQHSSSISGFIIQGFHFNFYFWKLIINHHFKNAMLFVLHDDRNYTLGFSLITVSLLSIIDLVAGKPQ